MATQAEIEQLRRLVAEPDETNYTDEVLAAILDASTSMDGAAAEVWTLKASSFAELVDISEGGSQRKNSDLVKSALGMVALFEGRVAAASGVVSGARQHRLAR